MGVSDLPATRGYTVERCVEIRTEVFSLLLERKDDRVGVLHVILAGRTVTHQFIGRLSTIRETILPQYAGCELRECDELTYESPEQAFRNAATREAVPA
jgi:hypothetical protein